MSEARDNYLKLCKDLKKSKAVINRYVSSYVNELESKQSEAIKMLKELSQSTTASFMEIDEVIKILE